MIPQEIVEDIKNRANRKDLIDKSESHIVEPFNIENWMVIRVMNAVEEWNREQGK